MKEMEEEVFQYRKMAVSNYALNALAGMIDFEIVDKTMPTLRDKVAALVVLTATNLLGSMYVIEKSLPEDIKMTTSVMKETIRDSLLGNMFAIAFMSLSKPFEKFVK